MRKIKYFLIACLFFTIYQVNAQSGQYYEWRTYTCSSSAQLDRLHSYLEHAFVPLLHELGIGGIGVFSSIENDTADQKRVFILIPSYDLSVFERLSDQMVSHVEMEGPGEDYLLTAHDRPVYDRIEISWHRAFKKHPQLSIPDFSTDVSERIFEFRSYEAASEILYRRKVHMFDEGGEIELFESLGFNAIFYAETLAGARTPNLVYMTSFENMQSREEHWDAFRADPRWKEMSGLPIYQNTVSKADIYLLHPTAYSDIK